MYILSDPLLAVSILARNQSILGGKEVFSLDLSTFQQRAYSRNLQLRLNMTESLMSFFDISFKRIGASQALSIFKHDLRITTDSYMLTKRISSEYSMKQMTTILASGRGVHLYNNMADLLIAGTRHPYYFSRAHLAKTRYLWRKEVESQLVSLFSLPHLPHGPASLMSRNIDYFDTRNLTSYATKCLIHLCQEMNLPRLGEIKKELVIVSPEFRALKTSLPILKKYIVQANEINPDAIFLLKPHPSHPINLQDYRAIVSELSGNFVTVESDNQLQTLICMPIEIILIALPVVKFVGLPTGALSFLDYESSKFILVRSGHGQIDKLYMESYFAWYHFWSNTKLTLKN